MVSSETLTPQPSKSSGKNAERGYIHKPRETVVDNKRNREEKDKDDTDLENDQVKPSKKKKLTEEEERAKKVRDETKKIVKELKGSKQKQKEDLETKNDGAKEFLRNQREIYRKKQISNSGDVDKLFDNFRSSLKDPNKSGIKIHNLTFAEDINPLVDLHTVEEYSVFDPRTGKGLVEEDKRMNLHNQRLRAQKKK